jgi:hypothetical protein
VNRGSGSLIRVYQLVYVIRNSASYIPSRESCRCSRQSERGHKSRWRIRDRDRGSANREDRVGRNEGADGYRLKTNNNFRLYFHDMCPVRAIWIALSLCCYTEAV